MGEIIRNGDIPEDLIKTFPDGSKTYAYELTENDIRYRVVVFEWSDEKKVITMYSDRNTGKGDPVSQSNTGEKIIPENNGLSRAQNKKPNDGGAGGETASEPVLDNPNKPNNPDNPKGGAGDQAVAAQVEKEELTESAGNAESGAGEHNSPLRENAAGAVNSPNAQRSPTSDDLIKLHKDGGKAVISTLEPAEVAEVEKILNDSGIEFAYKKTPVNRVIDSEGITHILREHGNEATEAARGNIAVTFEDIANYENIIKSADMSEATATKNAPRIAHGKQVNGYFIVVEEARTKTGELRLVTMRKQRGKLTRAALWLAKDKPHRSTSETTPLGQTPRATNALNESIPQARDLSREQLEQLNALDESKLTDGQALTRDMFLGKANEAILRMKDGRVFTDYYRNKDWIVAFKRDGKPSEVNRNAWSGELLEISDVIRNGELAFDGVTENGAIRYAYEMTKKYDVLPDEIFKFKVVIEENADQTVTIDFYKGNIKTKEPIARETQAAKESINAGKAEKELSEGAESSSSKVIRGVLDRSLQRAEKAKEQIKELNEKLEKSVSFEETKSLSAAIEEQERHLDDALRGANEARKQIADGAIDLLLNEKQGEVKGALHNKHVGDIDLPWGEAGTGKSDGWGLAKIEKFHPEVLDNLQEILSDMEIKSKSENRIRLESDRHSASVRLDYNGEKKKWLLTAYEKETSKNATPAGTTNIYENPKNGAIENGYSQSGVNESISQTAELSRYIELINNDYREFNKPINYDWLIKLGMGAEDIAQLRLFHERSQKYGTTKPLNQARKLLTAFRDSLLREKQSGGGSGDAGKSIPQAGDLSSARAIAESGSNVSKVESAAGAETSARSAIAGERGSPLWENAESAESAAIGAKTKEDFSLEDTNRIYGGASKRADDNLKAIRLLKQLESEDRAATKEEQEILSRYVGWGGVKEIFTNLKKGWENRFNELKSLLTDDEYKAARSSTQYAHYTDYRIVKTVWKALDKLGLLPALPQKSTIFGDPADKTIRVLEPSAGVGNFFMFAPKGLRFEKFAVEKDDISARIAAKLFPNTRLAKRGFEETNFERNSFDLIIGNPPFSENTATSALDQKFGELAGMSLHNYFLAKSAALLKEGGAMGVIVTRNFMDAANADAREYLQRQGLDLMAAVRLPNNSFKENANTSVTTDLLIFRKRKAGETALNDNWVKTAKVEDINGGEAIKTNAFFAENPENMFGVWARAKHGQYGANEETLIAREGSDIFADLDKWADNLSGAETKTDNSRRDLAAGENRPAEQNGDFRESQETKSFVGAEALPSREIERKPALQHIYEMGAGAGDIRITGDGKLARIVKDELGDDVLEEVDPIELLTTRDEFNAFDLAKQEKLRKQASEAAERYKAALELYSLRAKLSKAELNIGSKKEDIEALRGELNKTYDDYTREFGAINAPQNSSVLGDTAFYPTLQTLEDVKKISGKRIYERAGALNRRSQFPYVKAEKADSAVNALAISLDETGGLDLARIAELRGIDESAAERELLTDGLAFYDPKKARLVAKDEYLSGNVKAKLREAKAAYQETNDPRLAANIEELEKIQPAKVSITEVHIPFASAWIPIEVMEDFAREVLKTSISAKQVIDGKWKISVMGNVPSDVRAIFATEKKDLEDVLNAAANQRELRVNKKDNFGNPITDIGATQEANAKVKALKEAWSEWLTADGKRAIELEDLYNERFNNLAERKYDGSKLSFIGKVHDAIVKLRTHQKNAAFRILQEKTALLDHTVGSGKTFSMISAIMELRRQGQAKKIIVVVPNHLVEQWRKDFAKLYPESNVLAIGQGKYTSKNRNRLNNRIMNQDFDAVIMPISSFTQLGVSPQLERQYLEEEIRLVMEAEKAARIESGGKRSQSLRDLERKRESLQDKIKSRQRKIAKRQDKSVWFDELGIDALFVDEAQEFKNLGFATTLRNVAGIGNAEGSQRAQDLFYKTRFLSGQDKRIVFATGTPISNSLTEAYTLQRYLDYETLRRENLAAFDNWVKQFGQIESDFEVTGVNTMKERTRLRSYVNVAQLKKLYKRFADCVTTADVKRIAEENGEKLMIPPINGGKAKTLAAEISDHQREYFKKLQERADNIKRGDKDNMLNILTDGNKASLDYRLIDKNAPDFAGSKVNLAVDNIVNDYKAWEKDKGTQLVFCDLSTPKKITKGLQTARKTLEEKLAKANAGDANAEAWLEKNYSAPGAIEDMLNVDGFSVYDDVKQKLIARGIPENEIAFIHDFEGKSRKEELFDKVNKGEIRVLLGSSGKMGSGMNVQERLVSLHHLDCPYRPSDLEQRNGRKRAEVNALRTKYFPQISLYGKYDLYGSSVDSYRDAFADHG
ncbi:MAG: DEAD/DEAH box helicase family protein, partial [Helicobacteraceae bacterium]|nr:DEAD/DEAH box helicase family protein [Helicobacteraceae bacterium]